MADDSEVRVDVDGGVAVLLLDAPARRNALTLDLAAQLVAACDRIDADESVGGVVVTGGPFFCAGAHRDVLAEAAHDPASDRAYHALGLVYHAFVRVGELQPPTIAAVRGGAVGAGVNLALATDLRIVAHDARIVAGFTRLGLHPGGGHFTLAARTGGRETAAALGIFGAEIDGRRAVELGVAWESLPDDAVEARAVELARAVAGDPALARRVARTMRMELGPPGVSWQVALETERAAQMWSLRRQA